MNSTTLAWLAENYQWRLSLYAGLGIIAAVYLCKAVAWTVPTMRAAARLNAETYRAKMEKPHYAANQAWNRKWSVVPLLVIFAGVLPFCITAESQPWWQVLVDTFVILMFYDFFYYLTHRFVFHDSDFFGGPLMWMHAVHHRQHNPCRGDSSYIHPLEIALGLGLYVASILVLSLVMGKFPVITIVVTWIAFNQINLHNHNRWTESRFPWRYVSYLSAMHHNHHVRFTGGNFATISLLYDWMFGTLDKGQGYPALDRLNARRAAKAKRV